MTYTKQFPLNIVELGDSIYEGITKLTNEDQATLDILNNQFGVNGHNHDGTDSNGKKIIASNVVNTPAGTIISTNIQAAINELDAEKAAKVDTYTKAETDSKITELSGLVAGNVANTPTGGISATTVQSAINELDIEKVSKAELGVNTMIGYGIIDDTTAIQAAIDGLSSGGTLLLNGNFKVSNKLIINKSCTIRGNKNTIIYPTDNSKDVFYVTSGDVSFDTFQIIESGHSFTPNWDTIGCAINIVGAGLKNFSFKNVVTIGMRGIYFDIDYSNSFENAYFESCACTYSILNGITLSNISNVSLVNCIGNYNKYDGLKLDNNTYNVRDVGGVYTYNGQGGFGSGIDTYAGGNGFIAFTTTAKYNNGNGIEFMNSGHNDISLPKFCLSKDNQLICCNISNNTGEGVIISNINPPYANSLLPSYISINDCLIESNTKRGIDVNGSKYLRIRGNTIRKNSRDGIIVRGSYYVTIADNTIAANSNGNAGLYSGIELQNSKHIVIRGGHINGKDDDNLLTDDETTATVYQSCGISINSALTCDDIFIDHPNIRNYTVRPITVISPTTDAITKQIIINYGDIGSEVTTACYGSNGSTLVKSGVIYTKTTNITSNTWDALVQRREGTLGLTADGTTKVYSIPHGLGKQPIRFTATPRNDLSASIFSIYSDATAIYVAYVTAPAAGSLSFNWSADA